MTKRIGMVAALAAALLGCAHEAELLERADDGCGARPTEEMRFSCRVSQRIEEGMAGASVEVLGPLEIAVAVGPDVRARADLEPLLAVCRDAPDLCAAGVDTQIELLRSALELGAGPAPIDASAVRAVIKPREYLDELRVAMRADGVPEDELEASLPVHRPFIGDLVTVYVQDLPSSMAMLMPESAARLGLDAEALDRLALRNLRVACRDFGHAPVEAGSRIRRLTAGDSYESSRLLLPEAWRPLAETVEGELLVAAPSRDVVLFTGDANAEDVARLHALAREHAATDPWPIDETIFRLGPDGWTAAESSSDTTEIVEGCERCGPNGGGVAATGEPR